MTEPPLGPSHATDVPAGTVVIEQSWQRHVTCMLLLVTVAALIAWDTYASYNAVHSDTISEVTLSLFWLHPSIVAACGYISGHLTWPNNNNHLSKPVRAALLLAIAIPGFLSDFAFHLWPAMPPACPFLLFYIIGHFCWPQVLEEGSA